MIELFGHALLAAIGASFAVVALEHLVGRSAPRDAAPLSTPRPAKPPRERMTREDFVRMLRARLDGPNAGRVRALVLVSLDGTDRLEVLSEAESRLTACACPTDLVARLGAGELAVLLDAVDAQATRRRLERLVACARACTLAADGREGAASRASLGCARLAGTVSATEAMARAAAALEEARHAGGGCRVHVVPSPPGDSRCRLRDPRVAIPLDERESRRGDAFERVRASLKRAGRDTRGAWVRFTEGERFAVTPHRLALARRLRTAGARVIVEVDAEAPLASERIAAMPCDALLIDASARVAPALARRRDERLAGIVAAARASGLQTIARLPDDPVAARRVAACRADWLVDPGPGAAIRAERLWSTERGFELAA